MNKTTTCKVIIPLILCGVFILCISLMNITEAKPDVVFKKHVITTDFISEGVAVADINKDEKIDIIAGAYWFEAPDWKQHEIEPGQSFDPAKKYSNSFLNFTLDVNHDGWEDLVLIDFPGKHAVWFENPKNEARYWKKHSILEGVGIANESPAFVDVDKDGRLDIVCGDLATKEIVWLHAPVNKNEIEWKRFPISLGNVNSAEIFAHGLGFGDINNDGRNDIIVKSGWWEGPEKPKEPNWRFHSANLGEDCSHMLVLDVNNDKLNDVVSASAHKLGIWWHEQLGNNKWKTHLISEVVTQTHAAVLADINNDGKPDFITDKRFLAHHDSDDPGTKDPSLLLWFESTP